MVSCCGSRDLTFLCDEWSRNADAPRRCGKLGEFHVITQLQERTTSLIDTLLVSYGSRTHTHTHTQQLWDCSVIERASLPSAPNYLKNFNVQRQNQLLGTFDELECCKLHNASRNVKVAEVGCACSSNVENKWTELFCNKEPWNWIHTLILSGGLIWNRTQITMINVKISCGSNFTVFLPKF